MRSRTRLIAPGIVLAILAGCVPKTAPRPAAPPRRVPVPAAAPTVVPPGVDWRDWAVTPGNWRYSGAAGGSIAAFGPPGGEPLLSLRCEQATRTIEIARAGGAGSATVRTTSTSRVLPLAATAGGRSVARLPASDSLLDAMGFSRGKFVVEGAGAPALVLPAWAEVLRVVEDCRD